MKISAKTCIVIAAIAVAAVAGVLAARACRSGRETAESANYATAESAGRKPARKEVHPRFVSISPMTTEALFALGLGDNVAGVSEFCDFPEEAAKLPKVFGAGGVDTNAIARLRPDVIVAPKTPSHAEDALRSLGADVFVMDLGTLKDIFDSMWLIGETYDRAEVAAFWLEEMDNIVECVGRDAPKGDARPRVMVVVGRDPGGIDKGVFIAGNSTFYGEVVEMCGGINVYQGDTECPFVTKDAIVRLAPDVIIDIIAAPKSVKAPSAKDAMAHWKNLPVAAVSNGCVNVITESWASRPGPRIGFLIDGFAQIISASGK